MAPFPRFMVALLPVLFGPMDAWADVHLESFSTTTFRDVGNTTADWDAASGTLRMRPFQPTVLGGFDTPGVAIDVAVSGTRAFVADETAGLTIYDLADPGNPQLLGSLNTPGTGQDVVLAGTLAYLADGPSGLQIIDVSQPTAPVLVGNYNTPSGSEVVVLSGSLAYVADLYSGLQIIDVSIPSAPVLVGSYDTPSRAEAVVVQGRRAFVADSNTGLIILDVSNPAAPVLLGTYDTPGISHGVAVSGNVAYVADGPGGLYILDVSNPATPVLLANRATVQSAYGVSVSGTDIYVAETGGGVQAFDVSTPSSPVLEWHYDTVGGANAVTIEGELGYVAVTQSGIEVLRLRDVTTPALLGSYGALGNSQGLALSGDRAYVADAGGGVKILNMANAQSPTLLGALQLSGDALDIVVEGPLAYVAWESGNFRILDVSNPSSPVLVGSFDTPGIPKAVAVSGRIAYVADHGSGLTILNVSNPAAPSLIASYDTPHLAYGVAVSATMAFVADWGSGLQIVNVSNPSNPTFLGAVDTPGTALDVALAGTLALVADGPSGLQIINVTNPAVPTIVGSYDTPGNAIGVSVSGRLAAVADDLGGVHVIDIRNPASPSLIGTYVTPGKGSSVAFNGSDLCLVGLDTGFQTLEVMQDRFDLARTQGQSLAIDTTPDAIQQARLTSIQTGNASWQLSVDGGVNWVNTVPGENWQSFGQGSDLRWRVNLLMGRPYATVTPPSVDAATIEWTSCLAPGISMQPVPNVVPLGGPAQFQVMATGAPSVSYQWRRNGIELISGGPVSGVTAPTLVFSGVRSTDTGNYDVVVTTPCGSLPSQVASLSLCSRPAISWGVPSEWIAVDSTSITVLATGGGLQYQWYKHNVPLVDGGHISGATTPTLRINPLTITDGEIYHVKVSNACGTAQSGYCWVKVLCQPPIITQQPQSQVVVRGSTATFTVHATETCWDPPYLAYEWRMNGQRVTYEPLSGPSSSYSVPYVSEWHEEQYWDVIVTNGFHRVQSRPVGLNVGGPRLTSLSASPAWWVPGGGYCNGVEVSWEALDFCRVSLAYGDSPNNLSHEIPWSGTWLREGGILVPGTPVPRYYYRLRMVDGLGFRDSSAVQSVALQRDLWLVGSAFPAPFYVPWNGQPEGGIQVNFNVTNTGCLASGLVKIEYARLNNKLPRQGTSQVSFPMDLTLDLGVGEVLQGPEFIFSRSEVGGTSGEQKYLEVLFRVGEPFTQQVRYFAVLQRVTLP